MCVCVCVHVCVCVCVCARARARTRASQTLARVYHRQQDITCVAEDKGAPPEMSRRTFSSPIFFLVRLTMTDPNPMPPQQPAVRVASQQVCIFLSLTQQASRQHCQSTILSRLPHKCSTTTIVRRTKILGSEARLSPHTEIKGSSRFVLIGQFLRRRFLTWLPHASIDGTIEQRRHGTR